MNSRACDHLVSRSALASCLLLLGACSTAGSGLHTPTLGQTSEQCAGSRDLALRNGHIFTLSTPAEVSELVIRDGRVVHIGPGGRRDYTPCTREIDLRGRTAIPGLIDAHLHLVTWGFRPGNDIRFDLATSVADIERSISQRAAALQPGEWITSVGGWKHAQLGDNRAPTLIELDRAAPANPVFLWERTGEAAVTNSSGKTFFESKGIVVAADGSIGMEANQAPIAYAYLAQVATDPARGTRDDLAYLAKVGLTTVSDAGVAAGPPGSRPPEKSWHSGHVDVYTAYDPLLALARSDALTARVRFNFMATPEDPDHHRMQLRYQFPMFGNDMISTLCMGEYITLDPAQYEAAALGVAQRGWCHEQHVMGPAENRRVLDAWENVDAQTPIRALHWRLAHAWGIEQQDLDRLLRLDAGLDLSPIVLEGGPAARSVAYRTILASGVKVGAVSDGPNYLPVNPWVHLSIMVTGKDGLGRQVVAPDQTLTRLDALKLFTVDNAWFIGDDCLGVLRPGSYGDVVVLDQDYFTVPDEKLRTISPVLTIVGGRSVFDRSAD